MSERYLCRRDAIDYVAGDNFFDGNYALLRKIALVSDFLAHDDPGYDKANIPLYSFEEIIKRDQMRGEIVKKYTSHKDEL